MNLNKILSSIFIILSITIIFLLVSGSSLLTISLNASNSFPSGTLITYIGLISLPCAIYFGSKKIRNPENKPYRFLSKFLKTGIFLALLWLPVSYLLAGNFSFTFSQKNTFQGGQLAMKFFWYFTYSPPILSVLILLMHLFLITFSNNKRK